MPEISGGKEVLTCKRCTDEFEYTRKNTKNERGAMPKYCAACVRKRVVERATAYKKRRRAKFLALTNNRKLPRNGVGSMMFHAIRSTREVAKILGTTHVEVARIEFEAFQKMRAHPVMQALWKDYCEKSSDEEGEECQ